MLQKLFGKRLHIFSPAGGKKWRQNSNRKFGGDGCYWQPVWTTHPSRIGCKHVWCSSMWAVSTILRQEWDSLFHKSSWSLSEAQSPRQSHQYFTFPHVQHFYIPWKKNVPTFYRQSFSSSQLSPGQARRFRKKRSACRDRKQCDRGGI